MKITKVEKINLKGIAVRTDNSSEMNPVTAKIGPMWEKFYGELASLLKEDSTVYGLYTNYESDHNGVFDVVACSDNLDATDLSSYQIQAGNYLVFKGEGQMPQVVIDLWSQVWEYFESPTCEYKRAYATDFELYKSGNEIEIYISV